MISRREFEQLLEKKDYQALEAFKVKNAIILAAGLSSRFKPFSNIKPKALANVKDEVLIERQIKQLKQAGIEDIYVIVGYKKEAFYYLEKQGVKIIENDSYNERNNTGSLMLVADILDNSYICSSDNYLEKNIFQMYNYQAYYSAVYKQGETDEWCIFTDSNNIICDVQIGGKDCPVMLGPVYFDRQFSKTFIELLKDHYYQEDVIQKVWEHLYIQHLNVLKMECKLFPDDVIQEFDSVEEAILFDKQFIEKNQDVFDCIK